MKQAIKLMFIALLLTCRVCWGQDNVIETILSSQKSIVSIEAWTMDSRKNPRTKAVINPKTGQMILNQQVITAQQRKYAAGVIVAPSGFIVTNCHAVLYSNKIFVKFADAPLIPAKIIKIQPENDLALLKVNVPYNLPAIEFADSNDIQLKEDIINIGNSPLLKETLSAGKIIGLGTNELTKNVEFFKVNLNLYKGDSGGPILDKKGRLVGMVMGQIRGKNETIIAIPSNKIKILYLNSVN